MSFLAQSRARGVGAGLTEPAVLLIAVASAMTLRIAVAGGPRIPSTPSGLVFISALVLIALAAGWRPALPRWQGLLSGVGGAAVLCTGPLVLHFDRGAVGFHLPLHGFVAWGALVVVVAVAEEVVLRGVLYASIAAHNGELWAVLVAAAAFGLMHVPIYGWAAVPVDIAVGLWLGGLRATTGGVAAPAVAHALADVTAWWLV